MSLMNDMLRDLEKRQAPDRTQQIEAQGYGALTQKSESHASRAVILLLGVIIIMLMALAVGWWYFQSTPQAGSGSVGTGSVVENNSSHTSRAEGRVDRTEAPVAIAEQASNLAPPSSKIEQHQKPSTAPVVPSEVEHHASKPKPERHTAATHAAKETNPRDGANDDVAKKSSSVAAKPTPTKTPRSTTSLALANADVEKKSVEKKSVEQKSVEKPRVETQSVDKVSVDAKSAHKTDAKALATYESATDTQTIVNSPKREAGAISKVLVISPEQRDEQMVDAAEALVDKGDRQDAKTQLMGFIDKYDTDVKSRALLVSLLMQDGHMVSANALLTDDKVAESSHLRRLKAHWLTQNGQTDEAVALLNSARPAIEADPEYHVLLAALYQQQGFSSEAVAAYAELISYNPDVADWWAGMAIALDSSQQYPSAKRAYQKALQMDGLRFELADFARQRLATLGG